MRNVRMYGAALVRSAYVRACVREMGTAGVALKTAPDNGQVGATERERVLVR